MSAFSHSLGRLLPDANRISHASRVDGGGRQHTVDTGSWRTLANDSATLLPSASASALAAGRQPRCDRFNVATVTFLMRSSPAGHRIGLGYAVGNQAALTQRRAGVAEGHKATAIEEDVLVDLVGENQNVRMLVEDCAKRLHIHHMLYAHAPGGRHLLQHTRHLHSIITLINCSIIVFARQLHHTP